MTQLGVQDDAPLTPPAVYADYIELVVCPKGSHVRVQSVDHMRHVLRFMNCAEGASRANRSAAVEVAIGRDVFRLQESQERVAGRQSGELFASVDSHLAQYGVSVLLEACLHLAEVLENGGVSIRRVHFLRRRH